MIKKYTIVHAPSIYGLRTTGVELMPFALQQFGFMPDTPRLLVQAPAQEYTNVPGEDGVSNSPLISEYAERLSKALQPLIEKNLFPIVVGGDCSILLGCMLALRRMGRYGLAHVDGHADFYQPEAEPNGEAASMDLALVTGKGPQNLVNIDSLVPYVMEEDVVQIGQRDLEETIQAGSRMITDSRITCFDLAALREKGWPAIISQTLQVLDQPLLKGYWIHFDVDVLNDNIMPAVDYRIPDGLDFEEAGEVLENLLNRGRSIGISITIFNPKMDKDGALTRNLVAFLHRLFQAR